MRLPAALTSRAWWSGFGDGVAYHLIAPAIYVALSLLMRARVDPEWTVQAEEAIAFGTAACYVLALVAHVLAERRIIRERKKHAKLEADHLKTVENLRQVADLFEAGEVVRVSHVTRSNEGHGFVVHFSRTKLADGEAEKIDAYVERKTGAIR